MKRWARKYDSCLGCGTTDEIHWAKGYCYVCYPRHSLGVSGEYIPRLKWSRNYECCLNCGTTENPHKGKGYCIRCYTAEYRDTKKLCAMTENAIKTKIEEFERKWVENSCLTGEGINSPLQKG